VGKFTTPPPDWTDVESMLRAIDALHQCKTGLLITARGIGATGGLHLEVLSEFDVLPGSNQLQEVQSTSDWPNAEGCTLATHVFGGLYIHDRAIQTHYEQLQLTK